MWMDLLGFVIMVVVMIGIAKLMIMLDNRKKEQERRPSGRPPKKPDEPEQPQRPTT